jgi:CHASE1-domain containing sensor protein
MKRKQYFFKSFLDSKYYTPIIWIIGLTFSLILAGFYYTLESKRVEIEFKNEVDLFATSLHKEFGLHLESLHTLATLFKLEKEPTYENFITASKSISDRNTSFSTLI